MEDIVINKNWKKTFFIIWLGQAFSFLGSNIVSFAMIWWLTEKTGSATILLISTLMSFLPNVILGPFAGVFVDRHNRKTIMMLADTFIAISTLILVIVGLVGDMQVWLVLVIMFLRSIGSTFHSPALSAAIPLLVPKENLDKAAGWNQMLIAGSQVIGPIIGASLFVFMSIEYIAMIDIIGALIAVTSLFFVKLPELKVVKEEKTHVMTEMKEGFTALKASKGLFKLSILIALFQLACIPLGTLFPLMTKSHFGGDAINASIVETAFGIGMVVGSILLGVIGCKNKKVLVMLLAAIVFGATTMISGLLPASLFIVFAILSGIMGITASFCSGLYTALIQLKITPEKLGRVFSIINTIILVATPVGMIIAAPICDTFGVGVCFIIFGALATISGIVAFFIKDIMNMEKESQVDSIEQTILE